MCQVLDDCHILREADRVAENQGKEAYFLLNIDGSLPFPGTVVLLQRLSCNENYKLPLIQNKSQSFSNMVFGFLNR